MRSDLGPTVGAGTGEMGDSRLVSVQHDSLRIVDCSRDAHQWPLSSHDAVAAAAAGDDPAE